MEEFQASNLEVGVRFPLPLGASGLEPETNGLKGRCSTIELRTRMLSRRIELLFLP